jgi:sigma-E factor negative regulatory protein RseA
MKSKISAMMDGELSGAELDELVRTLHDGGEALETWRRYHLISDAFRDTQVLSSGFSTRFADRLAQEPTILSPASLPRRPGKSGNRLPFSIAASGAAVALVGWLAFQVSAPVGEQIAQTTIPERASVASTTIVPMPGQVNDYLLAHQNYSPRSALQGVAPYVRTASDPIRQK